MYTFGKVYCKPSFCNCKIETVVIASNGWAFVKSDKVYQDLKNLMMQSTSVCIASLVLLLLFSMSRGQISKLWVKLRLTCYSKKNASKQTLSEMSSIVLMLCERGLAGYNPWPKSDLQPIFVNKVFLGTQPRHSFIYCLWLLPHCSRQSLSNCGRHCVDCKSCNIYLLGFYGRCLPKSRCSREFTGVSLYDGVKGKVLWDRRRWAKRDRQKCVQMVCSRTLLKPVREYGRDTFQKIVWLSRVGLNVKIFVHCSKDP